MKGIPGIRVLVNADEVGLKNLEQNELFKLLATKGKYEIIHAENTPIRDSTNCFCFTMVYKLESCPD